MKLILVLFLDILLACKTKNLIIESINVRIKKIDEYNLLLHKITCDKKHRSILGVRRFNNQLNYELFKDISALNICKEEYFNILESVINLDCVCQNNLSAIKKLIKTTDDICYNIVQRRC